MKLLLIVSFKFGLCSALLFCLLSASLAVQAKEIAITFDDSPRFATGFLSGPERAKKLIAQLAKYQVEQVAFFSNSSHLDQEGTSRLHAYANAGHIIANHTHDHANFNETDLSIFVDSFLVADKKLSTFANYRKWFRFPYLREGNTLEKRDGMRKALRENNYINGYVSVATHDWLIEDLFQQAIVEQGKIDMVKMKQFYVSSILANLNFYQQLAVKQLGQSPKHVLLLHETDTAALFIGDLISALYQQGWKVISPELAYADPLLAHQTQLVTNGNDGRIHEIARDKGHVQGLTHPSLDLENIKRAFKREVLD